MAYGKYNEPDCRDPQKGDWVRFYRSGALVIGEVQYINKTVTHKTELFTDNGTCIIDEVLEMRR